MTLDFNPSNIGKVNSLIQKHPQLNVTDNQQANYVDNFKKADADGNGQITRDEFKRFAKDALPTTTDLSMFGTGDTQLADFDAALGEWFDSLDQTQGATATAAVSEKPAALPPLDAGKTWSKAAAEKIARGEDLNFGHESVDGQLWKMQNGSPVWADTGTQVTREQLAAMPDYQVKKFYQMMGLGYDPKVDFPDAAARQKLASAVTAPDPGSPLAAASQKLETIRKDLDAIHGAIASRETALKAQLQGADPATSRMINAQLAQLGGFRQQLEGMRDELKDVQLPSQGSAEGEARLAGALDAIHTAVKQLAGADSAGRGAIMADFARQMNQIRQPERDMQKDPLAQNQYATLIDANRVLSALGDRMDQLVRQKANGADAATTRQIDAQLAQLQNLHQGFSEIAAPLFSYRPDPALSEAQRQEKAALIDRFHAQLKQMAGQDRDSFRSTVEQLKQQLSEL